MKVELFSRILNRYKQVVNEYIWKPVQVNEALVVTEPFFISEAFIAGDDSVTTGSYLVD